MSAREPIEIDDIRKGDLIRAEWGADEAREYRAGDDGQRYNLRSTHFLLDRPTRPVELPTEPTLGWVDFSDSRTEVGTWWVDRFGKFNGHLTSGYVSECWNKARVDSFTPATLVPTPALDDLRQVAATKRSGYLNVDDLDAFLAAVDSANGVDR